MPDWPCLTRTQAMLLLRFVTPMLFMVHAAVRIVNGSIPGFGQFMEARGFPAGEVWVWAITLAELGAGSAILLGWRIRWMTIPLLVIAAIGIALIHWKLGWFVGEHGVGGSEYSVALIVMLLVLAADDAEKNRQGRKG